MGDRFSALLVSLMALWLKFLDLNPFRPFFIDAFSTYTVLHTVRKYTITIYTSTIYNTILQFTTFHQLHTIQYKCIYYCCISQQLNLLCFNLAFNTLLKLEIGRPVACSCDI